MNEAQWLSEFHKYQAVPRYRELNHGMSLDAFKTIFWWEWTHRLIGVVFFAVAAVVRLARLDRARLARPVVADLRAWRTAACRRLVDGGLRSRSPRRSLAVPPRDASRSRLCDLHRHTVDRAAGSATGGPRQCLRACAVGLLVLVLGQIYLGALVAGLRAGYIYNTWPPIDGGVAPQAVRLFSASPAWRNFFENALTVQFDHRMLAYAIWLLTAWHVTDVIRNARHGPALAGALALFVAVTFQAALVISTLLLVVPLPLALLHQAMAMVVLTVAVLNAERMTRHATQTIFRAAVALLTSSRA